MSTDLNQSAPGRTRDTRSEDRAVGLVLRIGAYLSIVLIVLGGLVSLAHAATGRYVTEAGVLVLMSTPITRVLVAAIVFWREGDRRYAWISIGVFVILIGSSLLAALKILPTLER
ncbi:MAG TPA: DUF1634 domain-containing protein [Terriglobales bacterium]|nr:DUF1634 domain-containing protein [Terriglobales bacterium]